jgi:hypothetical protein
MISCYVLERYFDCFFYTYIDSNNQLTPLALVVYKFDGVAAHEVSIRPHGNSKSNKAYRRTRQSTKNLLKKELETTNPKEAVDKVFIQKGGLIEAQSAGELPRGRVQAYNMKRTINYLPVLVHEICCTL